MPLWLLVGIGGFIGAILRYAVSFAVQGNNPTFPWGTLCVNVSGSFLLGVFMVLAEKGFIGQEARVFFAIGVLGAFTTMSTFGYESFKMLEDRQTASFGLNLFGNFGLVLLSVFLGKLAAASLWGK